MKLVWPLRSATNSSSACIQFACVGVQCVVYYVSVSVRGRLCACVYVCVSVLTKLSCLSVVCVGSGMLSVVCWKLLIQLHTESNNDKNNNNK